MQESQGGVCPQAKAQMEHYATQLEHPLVRGTHRSGYSGLNLLCSLAYP